MHTIGRLKTARRLSEQRPPEMPPLQVCIEVNIAGEEAKHGVAPEEAVALTVEVAKLPNVVVRGLMCVAKAGSDDEALHVQFQRDKAFELFNKFIQSIPKAIHVRNRT